MSHFRVRYQTFEFDKTDIHVRTLRDNQEFSDDDDVALKLGSFIRCVAFIWCDLAIW